MLEIYQIENNKNYSLVYGKRIAITGEIIYYNQLTNIVTLSKPMPIVTNTNLIGYNKPELLENIPFAIGKTKLELIINQARKYQKIIQTIINKHDELELRIEIIKLENKIKEVIDRFNLHINDQFDYDLLIGEKIK